MHIKILIVLIVLIGFGGGGFLIYKNILQPRLEEEQVFKEKDVEEKCADTTGEPCPQFSKNVDCENKHFKMAFILVAQTASDVTSERLNKLSWIKNEFSKAFSLATRNLASIDTADDIAIISPQGDDENEEYRNIYKKFYETHEDIYDFISIFYVPPLSFHASGQLHGHVVQNIKGIGLRLWDNSSGSYSSRGKLKGINIMGSIDMYRVDEAVINGLLHETGHQWCCYVGDNFAGGEGGAKLEIIWENVHFYAGLHTPNEEGDALNANHWVSNNDGTYKCKGSPGNGRPPGKPLLQSMLISSMISDNANQYEAIDDDDTNESDVTDIVSSRYHPFLLYFMGLLPESEYDTKYQIFDAGGIDGMWNLERALPYKQVSVRDIIEVAGERVCVK